MYCWCGPIQYVWVIIFYVRKRIEFYCSVQNAVIFSFRSSHMHSKYQLIIMNINIDHGNNKQSANIYYIVLYIYDSIFVLTNTHEMTYGLHWTHPFRHALAGIYTEHVYTNGPISVDHHIISYGIWPYCVRMDTLTAKQPVNWIDGNRQFLVASGTVCACEVSFFFTTSNNKIATKIQLCSDYSEWK